MPYTLVRECPGTRKVRRAGKDNFAFRNHVEFLVPSVVTSRGQAGQTARIACQDSPRWSLHTEDASDDGRRKMVPIADDAGPEFIRRQLFPDVIRMSRQQGMGPVPQVC